MEGRAIGAIITACFGGLWMVVGAAVIRRFNLLTVTPIAGISGALYLMALARLHAAQASHHGAAIVSGSNDSAGLIFGIIVGLEYAAIFAAIIALRRRGRRDLIIPIIAFIVGVHLIALGWLFGATAFYFTAAGMIVTTAASFAMRDVQLRQATVCAACGLSLWITSAALIF